MLWYVMLTVSIILMLYSPRYPVNITFQGAAAKLSYFFSCVVSQVLAGFSFFSFFYFLMSTSQNYTKTIISLRLSKHSPMFTEPSTR